MNEPPCWKFLPEGNNYVDNSLFEILFPVRHDSLCDSCLYRNSPPVYLCVDLSGEILSVNRIGALSLGYLPEDLLKKSVFQLFAASEKPLLTEAFTRLSNQTIGNKNHYWYFQLECPGWNLAWVKINARTSASKDHKPVILMVFEEITACKHTKYAMEESEQDFGFLGATVDDIPVMSWMSSSDGCYSLFNKQLLTFIGYDTWTCKLKSPEQIIYHRKPSDLDWLELIHPDDKNLYLDSFEQAFSTKEQFQIEYRCKKADGEYRWLLDRGSPRFDEKTGNFLGYIGSCVDITESNLAKTALEKSKQALQKELEEKIALNHLRDEFLGKISHELRAPLSNMKMAIQMLGIILEQRDKSLPTQSEARYEIPSKADIYLQILNNECEREITLIDNFLDLQRLDKNPQGWVLESISVPEWLSQVVRVFQSRRCNCCKHDLQLDIASDIPLLTCDPFTLERIIIELLTNAYKFSPSGEKIIMSVRVKSQNIQFQVTNTGVEIPEAELARIFDKFYQIPSNDPCKQGGTGLGLALVEKLTESLRGNITVKSDSNYTCFTVQLPID